MKSLLKKGEKSDKGTAPKKSLFGKKPAKKVADDIDEPVAPKKTGFSLTKKRTATNADDTAEQGGKKAKPAKKSAKGGSMDTKKLVPILGGLLAVILLALAAKMFLLSEPEPEPVVPQIPPPPATPAPAQPTTPAAPAEQAPSPDQAQPAAPTAEAPVQPAPEAQSNQPVQVAPAQPTDMAPAVQAPQTRQFTREEFLQESKNKVYRERETTQSQPAAPSQ